MDDRSNTIAGWVLGAGIAVLGLSIITDMIFHAETPGHGKQGYVIQGVESSEGGTAKEVVPLANMMAAADMSKGESSFKKCTACHSIAQGGANGIGPNLWGTVGKGIAQGHDGFAFSGALSDVGGTWTFDALDAWLANPKKFAPGTKMTFAGLGNPEERAALLLYLNSQGSNIPLPTPIETAAAEDEEGAPEAEEEAQ